MRFAIDHRGLRLGSGLLAAGLLAVAAGFAIQRMTRATPAPGLVAAGPATPAAGSGRTPPGSSHDPIQCKQSMRAFDVYPLVWLGDTFEGLPLTGCQRRTTAPTSYGVPATDYFDFVYGECTPVGGVSCPVPLQVSVEPVCTAPVVDKARTRAFALRGAAASELLGGSIQIEARRFKARIISVRGKDQALRAAQQLEGANALASALTAADSFNDDARVSAGTKQAC